MPFSLFGNRRKKLLAEPFPLSWQAVIHENLAFYEHLNDGDRSTLRDVARVIIDEKNWEGCAGLEMTDEVRVVVAGQAALLLIGLEHDFFANVESILVYPSSYTVTEARRDLFVTESRSTRLGEAWSNGPVVLSWADSLAGARNESDGHNVVLHEFAHKLDFRDGHADGVPRLHAKEDYERWSNVMSADYQDLVAQSNGGHATLLNHYGATNPAEFFAVTTECFFERPIELQHAHPDLYEVFCAFYGQDPAERIK